MHAFKIQLIVVAERNEKRFVAYIEIMGVAYSNERTTNLRTETQIRHGATISGELSVIEDRTTNPQDEKKGLLKTLKEAFGLLKDALDSLSVLKKISYSEIFEYFISYNKDPRIVKGVLLKEAAKNYLVIYQVFLDKDNHLVCNDDKIPVGRKLHVEQLDNELVELFGSKDMVIVE